MPIIALTIAEPTGGGWSARADDGAVWTVPASALGELRTLRPGQRVSAEVEQDAISSVWIGPRTDRWTQ